MFMADNTSVSYPTPGIVPIICALSYPVVEFVLDNKVPVIIRCYTRAHGDNIKLDATMHIRVKIDLNDKNLIVKFRTSFNSQHVANSWKPEVEKLIGIVDQLTLKDREPLPIKDYSDRMPDPLTTLIPRNSWLLPKIQISHLP